MDDGDSVTLSQQQLEESVNNVFDLPSTAQTIRYLHACAGFPTRRTWIRAIKKGNFVGWPMVTVENVNKHFPESESIQNDIKEIKVRNISISEILDDLGGEIDLLQIDIEGGEFDLEVHGPDAKPRYISEWKRYNENCVIFNSDMWHRVRPVKSGIRKSIVGWVLGPP